MKQSPSEASIVKSIRRVADELGWFSIKIWGGGFQVAGIPDLLLVKNGELRAIEVKKPGLKPTIIQQRFMETLERHGARCSVSHSAAEARIFLTGGRDAALLTEAPAHGR